MTRHPGPIRIESHPRSKDELPQVHRTAIDVAANEVGVVPTKIPGTTDIHPDDAVPEAGGEPFDLIEDCGSSVTRVTQRHLGIGVQRVDVADRTARIHQVLLNDNDEWTIRHATACNGALGLGDLVERAADVNGAGRAAVLIEPWHSFRDGQVDLVCPAPVTKRHVCPVNSRR